MIKDAYKIDVNGIYVDVFKINTEKNIYYDGEKWLPIDFTYIDVQPPYANTVKWGNNNWIVVEEYPIEPIPPKEPTEIEKLQQELAGTNAMVLEFMETILMGGM